MELTTLDIHELVSFGKNENADESYFRSKDYLNRQHFNTWNELLRNLSPEDLISTYKAVIRLENTFGWIGGSVAAAIWVYKIMEGLGLDKDLSFADYALRNSKNPYVPFGHHYSGSRTIDNYIIFQKEKSLRRLNKSAEQLALIEFFSERKMKRKQQIARLRQLTFEERKNIREKLLCDHQSSSVLERMVMVANDDQYPPEFYPREWINISLVELQQLPNEIIQKLYNKLYRQTKGDWKRFAHLIEKVNK